MQALENTPMGKIKLKGWKLLLFFLDIILTEEAEEHPECLTDIFVNFKNITLKTIEVYMSAQQEVDEFLEVKNKDIYHALFFLMKCFVEHIKSLLHDCLEQQEDAVTISRITEDTHLRLCDTIQTIHTILDSFKNEYNLILQLKDGFIAWIGKDCESKYYEQGAT